MQYCSGVGGACVRGGIYVEHLDVQEQSCRRTWKSFKFFHCLSKTGIPLTGTGKNCWSFFAQLSGQSDTTIPNLKDINNFLNDLFFSLKDFLLCHSFSRLNFVSTGM